MRIALITIKNFRLLRDVELKFDELTTVIVGRNNSGKTSVTELFRWLLGGQIGSPQRKFELEDFSLSVHEAFWQAYQAFLSKKEEDAVRALLPSIEARIHISYATDEALGALSEFIIDLDPACTTAIAAARYRLGDGKIQQLFESIDAADKDEAASREAFFKIMRERIPKLFAISVHAEDPTDAANTRALEWRTLRKVVRADFITAQRGLDDTTSRENEVLGKVLTALFDTASSTTADQSDKSTVENLHTAIESIEVALGQNFNKQLNNLLPAFALFGYPSLPDPKLLTETTFNVKRLLTDHTRVRYPGANGVNLPETYNGLGARNLIFMLLKLHAFFKEFRAEEQSPGIHLVFIEEPEAHLHPQMQEVFIERLGSTKTAFPNNDKVPWPVQFAVTTHSSHVANKARFQSIRYFLSKETPDKAYRTAVVKDLSGGLGDNLQENMSFLHKYMTLTRCDLLFADKAILIEGASERLLLPQMIKNTPGAAPLSSQFVSTIEVGGAHAHRFFGLLAFLEVPTLVITDIDAIGDDKRACMVSRGVNTSNGCIKAWFGKDVIQPQTLLDMAETDKVKGTRRIAFELPEQQGQPCGRSFEQAFVLANPDRFDLDEKKLEENAWDEAEKHASKKVDFAIGVALDDGWNTPRYIAEGLCWLSSYVAPATVAADAGADIRP